MRNGEPLDDEAYAGNDKPIIPWNIGPVTSADNENNKNKGTPVTTINDGGDGEQLGSQVRDREPFDATSDITPSEPGPGRDNLFSHLGEGFQHESVPLGDLEVNPQNLEKELREALVKSAWRLSTASQANMVPVKKFLPLDRLDKIITKCSVKAELESWPSLDEENVALMTHAIWGLHSVCDKGATSLADNRMSKTTRRRLFAILMLAGKPQAILELIKDEIFDIHLPFTQDPETQASKIQRKPGDKPQDIAAFADWAERDHDLFHMYQWNLLAPYFALSSKESPKVHTYKLEGMRPLPFITDPFIARDTDPATGGFAEVRRVKIHEAHLDKGGHGVSVPCYLMEIDPWLQPQTDLFLGTEHVLRHEDTDRQFPRSLRAGTLCIEEDHAGAVEPICHAAPRGNRAWNGQEPHVPLGGGQSPPVLEGPR